MKPEQLFELKKYYQQAKNELAAYYESEESSELALLLVSYISGCGRAEILSNKKIRNLDVAKLFSLIDRLKIYEPIQYIIGFTYFYGLRFETCPGVFIPRGETEELVDMILKRSNRMHQIRCVDIGTGSGCIAISLAHSRPEWSVFALEVSEIALEVARRNASHNHVKIHFFQHDIQKPCTFFEKDFFDLIVSNPPYITLEEKHGLQPNVINFEPELALFSSPNDPIYFYKKIVTFASEHLKKGGLLYFEINQLFSDEIIQLLMKNGFTDTTIHKDLNNNDRFVSGIRI